MLPDRTAVCLYHADCADGAAAAWIVARYFEARQQPYLCLPINYNDSAPELENREVVIVDMSFERADLTRLARTNHSVLVLDHHKGAQDKLAALTDVHHLESYGAFLGLAQPFGHIYDILRSGAGLTWDFFMPNEPRPEWINLIEDRDLWRFSYGLRSKQFHLALSQVPFTPEDIGPLLEDYSVEQLLECAPALANYHNTIMRNILATSVTWVQIDEFTVPCVECPRIFQSSIGEALCQLEDAPFSMNYQTIAKDGSTKFSLRSLKGTGTDVDAVAQRFGGAGHENAAGFYIPGFYARQPLLSNGFKRT